MVAVYIDTINRMIEDLETIKNDMEKFIKNRNEIEQEYEFEKLFGYDDLASKRMIKKRDEVVSAINIIKNIPPILFVPEDAR